VTPNPLQERALLKKLLDELRSQFEQAAERERIANEANAKLQAALDNLRPQLVVERALNGDLKVQLGESAKREAQLRADKEQLTSDLAATRAAHQFAVDSFNKQLDEAKERERRLFETNQSIEKELQCARDAMQCERLNHQQALNDCSEHLNNVARTAEYLQRDNTTLADEVTRLAPVDQRQKELEQAMREKERLLDDARAREHKAVGELDLLKGFASSNLSTREAVIANDFSEILARQRAMVGGYYARPLSAVNLSRSHIL